MAGRSQTGTARKAAQAASPAVSREAIAQVAYELFQQRGGVPGHDVEDWLEAERIVRQRRRGRPAG